MEYLLYLLPLLGCAAVLLLMPRSAGGRERHRRVRYDIHPDHEAEIASLRAEIDHRGGEGGEPGR